MQAAKRSLRASDRWSSVTALALHSCPCFYSAKQWHTDYLLSGESIKLFLLQIRMSVMQNLSLCNISCLCWSSIPQAYQSWTPGLQRWQIAQVHLCWTELTHKQGKLVCAYLHAIETRPFLRAGVSTCILKCTVWCRCILSFTRIQPACFQLHMSMARIWKTKRAADNVSTLHSEVRRLMKLRYQCIYSNEGTVGTCTLFLLHQLSVEWLVRIKIVLSTVLSLAWLHTFKANQEENKFRCVWQELNREDTTTSLHYLLRAGQILTTAKSLDKTSGMVQPFQTRRNTERVWGSWDLPICARQHTKAYLTSPLALSQRWCTAHSRDTSTECGSRAFPGLRTWCWGYSHGRGYPLQWSWPPQSWQPAKSSQCLLLWARRRKFSYFYLNFLFALWNSSNSSLIQTCKRWLVFLKFVVCLWYSLMRKYRCKGILTFASFGFASLHINRIFNELI